MISDAKNQALTVAILICALNEEKNIGDLLDDIRREAVGNSFSLGSIYVVSDGSTDNTDLIVKQKQELDDRIVLLRNEKRIGKLASLEKRFQVMQEEVVILFDADIRLKSGVLNSILTPFLSNNSPLLAGGNPHPYLLGSRKSVAEVGSMFSWYLLDAIKKQQPLSIYSAHGRILALRKELYRRLDIGTLSTPGDDQFMFISAKGSFVFVPEAVVYYKLPSTIRDYLKQNRRFRLAKTYRSATFSDAREYFIRP